MTCWSFVPVVLLFASAGLPAQEAADPLILVQQGRRLNASGRQSDALALYERALTINPDLFEAHLASGIALDLIGRFDDARTHWLARSSWRPRMASVRR